METKDGSFRAALPWNHPLDQPCADWMPSEAFAPLNPRLNGLLVAWDLEGVLCGEEKFCQPIKAGLNRTPTRLNLVEEGIELLAVVVFAYVADFMQ